MSNLRPRVRFCTTTGDEVRIAYAQRGQGPVIVKVGNTLSHLDFEKDTPVHRQYAIDLVRDYTFVNYDPRGCGLSDRIVADVSFAAWLRDLEAVVDAAKLSRFALLALGGGAATALAYAARHPERVSHLVLHGGYAVGPLRRFADLPLREVYESIITLVEHGWDAVGPAIRQMVTMQFFPDATPEQYRAFTEFARAASCANYLAERYRVLYNLDVTQFAEKVQCPALVSHSINDPWVPLDDGRFLASLIPDAQFVPIRSRNHLLLDSEPGWQQWLEEVRAFLPRNPDTGILNGSLTRRERELVDLIARGLSNSEIATVLAVSPKTVKNHITTIFAKTDIDSRARLIVRARDAGFGVSETAVRPLVYAGAKVGQTADV